MSRLSDDSDMEDDVADLTSEMRANDPKRHARAQHNALERRRRDNIKDMYSFLRETVPDMQNERASRAMILRKAIEAIEEKQQLFRDKQAEAATIEMENAELERRVRELLEQRKADLERAVVTESAEQEMNQEQPLS